MTYVECFVAPVKSESEATYKDFVRNMGTVFKDYGANRVVDAWAADVPSGEMTSFPLAVKLEAVEVVAFGWIEWENKEIRDKGMEAAMADNRMQFTEMPMDGKRMIFGGFEVFSDKLVSGSRKYPRQERDPKRNSSNTPPKKTVCPKRLL